MASNKILRITIIYTWLMFTLVLVARLLTDHLVLMLVTAESLESTRALTRLGVLAASLKAWLTSRVRSDLMLMSSICLWKLGEQLKCLMFSLTFYSAHLRLMRKHDTHIKRLLKYFAFTKQHKHKLNVFSKGLEDA